MLTITDTTAILPLGQWEVYVGNLRREKKLSDEDSLFLSVWNGADAARGARPDTERSASRGRTLTMVRQAFQWSTDNES